MDASTTCWTVIHDAAAGRIEAREQFARRYEPIIRAYLSARWRASPLKSELEDAVQDAFVDCFRPDGALSRVDPARPAGFRGFLLGVVRNVALMTERKQARARVRPAGGRFDIEPVADEEPAERAFDRIWAQTLIQEAKARHQQLAAQGDEAARRRLELLRLRFEEGLPIREIARQWKIEAARLHREYALARREFRSALHSVVGFQNPGDAEETDRECRRLLASLV